MSSAGATAKDGVSSAGSSVQEGLSSAGEQISSTGSSVQSGLSSLGSWFQSGVSSAKDQASSAGASVESGLSSAGSSARDQLSSAGSSVQDGVSSAGSSMQSGLSSVGEQLSAAGSSVQSGLSSAGSWVQGGLSSARDQASSAGSSMQSGLSSASSTAQNELASAGSSMQSGLSSAGASVQDSAASAGSSVQSGWESLLATLKQGYVSVKEALLGANASVEHGLARADESLQSGLASASQTGQAYVSSAGEAGKSFVSSASETGRSLATDASHAGKDLAGGVHDAGAGLVSDAKGAVTSIQDRLANANHGHTGALPSDLETFTNASHEATTELTAHGLGGWSPSGMLQHVLDTTQYLTHLPWWATIILVTCAIRLSVAPLLVYVQGNSIRLSNIQPQMQNMLKDLEYAKSTGNQQEMQRSAVQVRKLLADNNCSPFRSLLLPAVQMPIFLSFYFALDGMAKAKLPALAHGGFGWVPDLTVADPYYVLPVTSALMTLLVLETGAETGTTAMNQTKQARLVKNLLRGVTVLAAWFVSNFPAAVLLYWTTTNTFSLVQLLALRTRFMKRWLKLPERVQHPVQPHIKQQSFMEGLRSGMASGSAHPGSDASVRRPPPASLYRKHPERRGEADARDRALDAMLSKNGTAKPAAPSHAHEEAAADKQSRVTAARERRLRQRN